MLFLPNTFVWKSAKRAAHFLRIPEVEILGCVGDTRFHSRDLTEVPDVFSVLLGPKHRACNQTGKRRHSASISHHSLRCWLELVRDSADALTQNSVIQEPLNF